MAGVVTVTESRVGSMKEIVFNWTSSAGGAADGATTFPYSGKLELLTTIPTDGPTDNYDLTLLDSDGVDVLAGAGANRATATTQQVLGSSLGAVGNSLLSLHVTNAGDTKSGKVLVHLR